MTSPYSPDFRISDTEREQAINDLGAHFAQGRLSMEEYERRLTDATSAVMRSDLQVLFQDLPNGIARLGEAGRAYTAGEIEELRQRGQHTRAGIMGLTTVGAFVGCIAFSTVPQAGILVPAMLALIPVVFILLFVMKVGPDKWYTPSARALERERMRELRLMQQRQLMASQAVLVQQRAEQKAIRQQRTAELNNTALEITNDLLKRFKR